MTKGFRENCNVHFRCMASRLQVVETEQMVFLGDRVRNCTGVVADDRKSTASAAALPAASDTTAKT